MLRKIKILRKWYHWLKSRSILLRRTKRLLIDDRRKVRKYPRVIQLPITHKCNFDCVMCGMHHMINRKDFTSKDLSLILSDQLYSQIESIGVNGGEPFLKNDLVDCVRVFCDKLPKLRALDIISNGYYTDKILSQITEIKKITQGKIHINLSISVDGVNDMQDFHRGRQGAFTHAVDTIHALQKTDLVDSLNIICTITRYNIARISELEVWSKHNNIDVAYNIATVNARIENEDSVKNFSIFSDEISRMLTQEFFFKKYLETKSERYFAIFLFIKNKKRYAYCPCKYNDWITLYPDGQVGFCATHSKNLGSGLKCSSYEIVKENLHYLDEIKAMYCDTCSHYSYKLTPEGLIELRKFLRQE